MLQVTRVQSIVAILQKNLSLWVGVVNTFLMKLHVPSTWGQKRNMKMVLIIKKMLFLCDIALGTGGCLLSFRVQAIRVICESLYHYELRTYLGYNCAEPGEIAASKLNLPSCLLAEIVNEIRNTVMVHYEHYVEPFIPSINP